jgi:hypothetical protein
MTNARLSNSAARAAGALVLVLALAACGRGEDPLRGAKDDLNTLRDELHRRSIVIDTHGHR